MARNGYYGKFTCEHCNKRFRRGEHFQCQGKQVQTKEDLAEKRGGS